MSNVPRFQLAAQNIAQALELLEQAKYQLRQAREAVHATDVHLAMTELQRVRDIITDPECTPEITGGR